MKKRKYWLITIGGGYGSFLFYGDEAEVEKQRAMKSQWEGAVGRVVELEHGWLTALARNEAEMNGRSFWGKS